MAKAEIDPRVSRSRELIRSAALEELAASGNRGATVEAIAARARVGKSTIYRIWGDRSALLIDALESINVQPVPDSSTSARTQVITLVTHFAQAMRDPVVSGWLTAMIEAADQDPAIRRAFHRYSQSRRSALLDAITAGVAAREFSPDTDAELVSANLIGTVLYARTMTPEPFDPAGAAELVALVLQPSSRK